MNGKLNGIFKEYKYGKPLSELNWMNGEKNGILRIWDKEGRLIEEISYVDDLRDGPSTRYYDKGVLRDVEDGYLSQRI